MGIPSSWTLLSALHYAICRAVDPKCDFRLKGDDIISLWTREQIASYTELSRSVGLILNDKTVVSKQFGTFCEGDYVIHGNVLVRQGTFSLRSFANNQPFSQRDGFALISRGVSSALISQMQTKFHSEWIRLAKIFRVDRYCNDSIGGLGFIPKNPRRQITTVHACALKAYHDGLGYRDPFQEEREKGLFQTGSFVEKLSQRLTQDVRWVASGQPNAESNRTYSIYMQRQYACAAFIDAVRGSYVKGQRPSRYRTVRRRSKTFFKNVRACTVRPDVNVTVRQANTIVSRAWPVGNAWSSDKLTRPAWRFSTAKEDLFFHPSHKDPIFAEPDKTGIHPYVRMRQSLQGLFVNHEVVQDEPPFPGAFTKGPLGTAARLRARRYAIQLAYEEGMIPLHRSL
jgi:hypothetical protein